MTDGKSATILGVSKTKYYSIHDRAFLYGEKLEAGTGSASVCVHYLTHQAQILTDSPGTTTIRLCWKVLVVANKQTIGVSTITDLVKLMGAKYPSFRLHGRSN